MFCYALLLLFLGTQVLQPNCGYESRADVPFSRILADALRMKYRRRKGENKTVIHWGQRKLFMSELEFLTEYGTPNTTVVYAGAAPGTHTRYLIDLFPDLKFVLVDPAPFSSKLSEGPRCFLRQELFTDEVAREFEGLDNVLFLCDIRSCDWSNMDDAAVEDKVLEDMLAQQQWHDIIKPRKSMLKFRLPWTPGQTEYLAGDVYLQAFGPITTTETRLIPHGHDRTLWDNKQYEEQMFYFNTVTRYSNTILFGSSQRSCLCSLFLPSATIAPVIAYMSDSHTVSQCVIGCMTPRNFTTVASMGSTLLTIHTVT
jgi:hypothetical protein